MRKHTMIMSNLIGRLDYISSKSIVKLLAYSSSIIFFFSLIFLPPVIGVLENITYINAVFHDPRLFSRANAAILQSFIMAFTVALSDLVAALPLAWFIARSKSRAVHFIDTLVDIPFLIPTAALGYSALLFWSDQGGISGVLGVKSLVSPGFILVFLLQFAFSYPVIVRVMVGELLNYAEYMRWLLELSAQTR